MREPSPFLQTRFAIYFTPEPDSAHWNFATSWLGRDPLTGANLPQPNVPGMEAEQLHKLTNSARRYGLHATLKPPFYLRSGQTLAALDFALKQLAIRQSPCGFRLQIEPLSDFLAWRPVEDNQGLNVIAASCVKEIDIFRAIPTPEETARRRKGGLTERQMALLEIFGYPFVLDEFRFHLTLTDALSIKEKVPLLRYLQNATRHLVEQQLNISALHLFVEKQPGEPFLMAARYGFDATTEYFAGWSHIR